MEPFFIELLKLAPAVAVLAWLVWRMDTKLSQVLDMCVRHFEQDAENARKRHDDTE